MKHKDVRDQIIGIISEQMQISAETVKDDSDFSDLGVDSLDFVEILMDIEDEFSITIPDEKAEKITTVCQAIECVAEILTGR